MLQWLKYFDCRLGNLSVFLLYTANQKTPEKEDDFYTQVMTFNSLINIRHRNSAHVNRFISLNK